MLRESASIARRNARRRRGELARNNYYRFYNLGVRHVGSREEDLGRYDAIRIEHDKGTFKTPMLRSIVGTAFYIHNGVFKTLEEVVDFLDQGGGHNQNLSPLLKLLGLNEEEKSDLATFLKALTGEAITFEMPKLPK